MRLYSATPIILVLLNVAAFAEPNCAPSPDAKWLTESEMKAKAVSLGYAIRVFKKTTGNCYEIYGRDAAGKRIEVYFHPVTGEPVLSK